MGCGDDCHNDKSKAQYRFAEDKRQSVATIARDLGELQIPLRAFQNAMPRHSFPIRGPSSVVRSLVLTDGKCAVGELV